MVTTGHRLTRHPFMHICNVMKQREPLVLQLDFTPPPTGADGVPQMVGDHPDPLTEVSIVAFQQFFSHFPQCATGRIRVQLIDVFLS